MSNISFIEALDQALHLLEHGYSLEECLAHFPQYADELRPLLMVSDDLRRLAHTTLPSDGTPKSPQPDWHRLLHGVPQQQPSATSRLLCSVRRSVRNAGLALFGAQTALAVRYATAGILSIALAVGVWNGADNSIPGSRMYSVKTAVEQFQILAALSDEERGKVHLVIALRRAAEVETLVEDGLRVPEHLLKETVDAAQRAVDAVEASGDLRQSAETRDKLSQVKTTLDIVHASAPPALQPKIQSASELVAQLKTQLMVAGIADASPTTVAPLLLSPTGTATGSATATATATSEPATAATPAPSLTPTPIPDVPTIPAPVLAVPPVQPPATSTPVPVVAQPPATSTPVPTLTNTPEPTLTNTPEPTLTNTPEPTLTNTPEPPPTSAPTSTTQSPMAPTENPTAEPTGTTEPTETAEPTDSPTAPPTVDPTTNASQTATAEPPTGTPGTPETTATPIPPVSPEQQPEQTTAVESDPGSSVSSQQPTTLLRTALLGRRAELLKRMPSSQSTATEQLKQSDDESTPSPDEPILNP